MDIHHSEILKKTSLFKRMSDEDMKSVLSCLAPGFTSYKKNELISVSGDGLDSIGILLKGEASVVKEDAAGRSVIMTFLKPGDLFGEMAAFLPAPSWPATVKAQLDCDVMFIKSIKITSGCTNNCAWHKILVVNLLETISKRALLLNKKVEYLMIKGMRAKICSYLLEQYKVSGSRTFTIPVNRGELAEFLNVSRPSMSRELCRMRDEGVIDFHLESFKINDLDALRNSTL